MRELAADLRQALDDAVEVARWVATFPVPDHELPDGTGARRAATSDGVSDARRPPREHDGLDIGVDEFPDHFAEVQVEHSTALHGAMLAGGDYLVGPLARFALNADHLAPTAAALADELGLTPPNATRSAASSCGRSRPCTPARWRSRSPRRTCLPLGPAVPVEPRAGAGCGWSEAPRGSALAPLRDRRRGPCGGSTDRPADVAEPAGDRTRSRPPHRPLARPRRCRTRGLCEQAVRNYDPCISCATHFLDMRVHRS